MLVNEDWILQYTSSQTEYLMPLCSDHSPGLITISDEQIEGKRPFKFFAMWAKHPDFLSTIRTVWEQQVQGYNMYRFYIKLKNLKPVLRDLNKRHFMNISEQVTRAKFELYEVQSQLSSDLFNSVLITKEKECIKKYTHLLDCENSFYRQKANISWGLHGDKSTQHFHSVMKNKRHHNMVLSLISQNGTRISDQQCIISEFVEYYKNLLGSSGLTTAPNPEVIIQGPILSPIHRTELSKPVTRDEIKHAVFSMPDGKAPGPDGFSASFFKSAWNVIKEDLFMAIEEFFVSGKLLGTLNTTSITLVPKILSPNSASDFRPIACCNVMYKIITKIIANRIQKIMGYLINDAQSAFVKGRLISSNFLLAHELIKHYGRKHISPRAIINVDLRKAFDTINWGFIKSMLEGMGFPEIMVGWIWECITTPKYSLSLNGVLHGYFNGARGLRQGDPLSPYLFVLGMEYLSRRLSMLKDDNLFKFHPKCSRLKLTHLIFADDLLLFSKADLRSITKLQACLQEFCQVSGLEANIGKCSVYLGGIDDILRAQICMSLGFSEGMLPMKYLGLPLTTRKLSHMECSPLISKIADQFLNWQQNRKLSYAGRVQLIKSVILGVQTFWFSSYILPIKVLVKIDKLCSSFLWGKIHLISWHTVCLEKKQGGLGLFSAKTWNLVAAVKLLWMIHQKKDLLWIKWIHGHYLKRNNIWQVQYREGDSWMWKQLLKVRSMLISKFGNATSLINTLESCCVNGNIQMKLVYNTLSQPISSVDWAYTTWGKLNYPKHSFTLWLVNHSRLLTQERLCRFRMLDTNCCVLCSTQLENCRHLFFDCQYSAEVWNRVMDWIGFTWRTCDWNQLIHWYACNLRGKGFKKELKRMALAATVYTIWQERNARIFQERARGAEELLRVIKLSIYSKLLNDNIPVHMKETLERL